MAHGHLHDHGHGSADPRIVRLLTIVVAGIVLAIVAGLVLLRPTGDTDDLSGQTGAPTELVEATVRSVERRACEGTEDVPCAAVEAEVRSGPTRGDTARFELDELPGTPRLEDGDDVVLGYTPAEESFPEAYYFADFDRDTPLALLALAFAAAVVALGRGRGLGALAGLAVTVVVLLAFLLPALLRGAPPVPLALVSAAAIAVVVLYLAHGLNVPTTTALLGTLASLALIALLSWLAVEACRFSGVGEEAATFLQLSAGQVDLRGLLLAGFVIGSLGVLDDVTVTQVSAVWELRRANPGYGRRELYAAGVRIGRDHISSTVNTLVLAYAGASLPLLLLFEVAERPLLDVLTGEVVAVELVRALVGSIGLVASVPITTALAAALAASGAPGAQVSSESS